MEFIDLPEKAREQIRNWIALTRNEAFERPKEKGSDTEIFVTSEPESAALGSNAGIEQHAGEDKLPTTRANLDGPERSSHHRDIPSKVCQTLAFCSE